MADHDASVSLTGGAVLASEPVLAWVVSSELSGDAAFISVFGGQVPVEAIVAGAGAFRGFVVQTKAITGPPVLPSPPPPLRVPQPVPSVPHYGISIRRR